MRTRMAEVRGGQGEVGGMVMRQSTQGSLSSHVWVGFTTWVGSVI